MVVKIQKEMIGLVQETHMYHFNQLIKQDIQTEEERNSQLICAQNQEKS